MLTHTTNANVNHLAPAIVIAAAMMPDLAAEQHVRAPDAG
jgi:hypothetical protein